MLERTAGCLESGNLRRLLPASGKSLKSCRSLHSSFWTHGAAEIELSPLWAALLRGPDFDPADQQHDTEQKILSGSGGLLLDFLYPAGTINFLRQYSGWSSDRPDGKRGRVGLGKFGHRLYTSSAKDASDQGREGDDADEFQEAPNIDADIRTLEEYLSQRKGQDYNVAWYRYNLLSGSGHQQLRHKLIEYLSSSKTILDAERIIELFEKLSDGEKDSEAFKSAIRSYLRLRNLSDAITLHEAALLKFNAITGSDELLAYLIENSLWSRAFRTWKDIQEFRKKLPSADNLFEVVKKIPKLSSRAFELADYVNKRLQNSDSSDPSTSELVSFAGIIVRYAMLHGTFDLSRFQDLLSFLRAWRLDNPQFYETAVEFLLEANQSKLAVKLYRTSREELDMRFSKRILHELLKVFCTNHSIVGMQQVLDDFFRFHRGPTPGAYRRCMKAFATMGDAETVHALFEQYLDRIKDIKTLKASDMSPILSVHAKRGELAKVIKHFDEIKEKYGLQPDLLCWNILLHAYCEVHDIDGAYACWENILNPSNGLTPDKYTFGTIMGMCVRNGDLERTVEVYRLADSMKIDKNSAMIDCLVLGHIQDDRYQAAEKICEEALNMDLKGSRTRMWNYLLVAHAMHRDLVNVNRILQRMSDANVDYDGMTYAALMQALAMVKQPDRAYMILKDVMKEAGIKVTNFHYAVVMGGYIATGEFHKVFELHDRMRQREMKLSASNNLLIIKAAFREDELLLSNEAREEQRRRAMQIFGEIASSMDPQDIASGPLKGDDRIPTDVAYPSMLYSYVLFVLAQHEEHATVRELYDQYLSILPENRRQDLPLSILSALMVSKYREGDYKSVQESWDIAMAQAKTHGAPVDEIPPSIYQLSGISRRPTPERKILPLHQFMLCRILTTYMNCLAKQERVDDLIRVVNGLLDQGFQLSNKNWNHYIQILSNGFRVKLAFTLCETKLMPGWTGWARIRWQQPERNRLPFEVRALKKEKTYLRPIYHTLLYLAKSFLEVQDMSAESKGYQMLLSDLNRDCPQTMQAIKTMQRIDGELERRILRDS